MADQGEHRMLFDLRGKRKHVVQVVYVILALLMVLSLFTVVGPLNPLDLFGGNSGSSSSAADSIEKQANHVEKQLRKDPDNAQLQGELVRLRSSAGNASVEVDQSTGQTSITEEATTQYDLAAQAWDKYLKGTKGKPDPSIAQLAATTLFTLAQGSSVAEFNQNIDDAAQAQKLFAASQKSPEAGTLTTLATYQFYAQDYAAAHKTRQQALDAATTPVEKGQVKSQLTATEKDAKRIGKEVKAIEKQSKGQGKQALQSPLGGLGTSSGLGGTATP